MNANVIIAPPFYFCGIQALTRQFPGTFTSKKETIIEAMFDYLQSLDHFGYKRCVMLNNHGDSLHKKALLEALKKANASFKLKTYWLEYVEDIEDDGFTDEVRTEKMVDLKTTNLSGERITKWIKGDKEDKDVIYYAIALANCYEIDLESVIKEKEELNRIKYSSKIVFETDW